MPHGSPACLHEFPNAKNPDHFSMIGVFGLYTKDGASSFDGQFFRQVSDQFPSHFSSKKRAHAGDNFRSCEALHQGPNNWAHRFYRSSPPQYVKIKVMMASAPAPSPPNLLLFPYLLRMSCKLGCLVATHLLPHNHKQFEPECATILDRIDR